jgi:hypothetical protein
VYSVQRERANSRHAIQKNNREKYICSKHKEETLLFNQKTKEFLCAQCFAEDQSITSVLKVKDMFAEADKKTQNLLDNFRNLKESFEPTDLKKLDLDLSKRKEKIITTLKTKVTQLKDLLDHNLSLEVAAVEKAFSKMEYLIKKQGLFSCNLSFKVEQDLSKLKTIEQKLAQGKHELEDVRFLETVLMNGDESIEQFFSPIPKNQVLKDLSISLIEKLKKNSLDFIHVISDSPMRVEIRHNQMFIKKTPAAKPEERTVLFTDSEAARIKSTLNVLAFADIVNELRYESKDEGQTTAKFTLANVEYDFVLGIIRGEGSGQKQAVSN